MDNRSLYYKVHLDIDLPGYVKQKSIRMGVFLDD